MLIPVFNMSSVSRQLPQMVAIGRYSADVEHRSSSASDMSVDEIVDALQVEGVDAAELARRKEDVKLSLIHISEPTRPY